jgi:hypothetical protein
MLSKSFDVGTTSSNEFFCKVEQVLQVPIIGEVIDLSSIPHLLQDLDEQSPSTIHGGPHSPKEFHKLILFISFSRKF